MPHPGLIEPLSFKVMIVICIIMEVATRRDVSDNNDTRQK